MKKLITSMVLVLSLLLLAWALVPTGIASAFTSQTVTVTALPSYIAITNTPSTMTLNSSGNGFIKTSTTYYANPASNITAPSATVLDSECTFTVTNVSSTVPITLTVNIADFTGGDAMMNTDTGTANATAFGAYSWYSSMPYSGKVIAKSTGSAVLKSNWSSATLKWGFEISTMTGTWTSSAQEQTTVTITATV